MHENNSLTFLWKNADICSLVELDEQINTTLNICMVNVQRVSVA